MILGGCLTDQILSVDATCSAEQDTDDTLLLRKPRGRHRHHGSEGPHKRVQGNLAQLKRQVAAASQAQVTLPPPLLIASSRRLITPSAELLKESVLRHRPYDVVTTAGGWRVGLLGMLLDDPTAFRDKTFKGHKVGALQKPCILACARVPINANTHTFKRIHELEQRNHELSVMRRTFLIHAPSFMA